MKRLSIFVLCAVFLAGCSLRKQYAAIPTTSEPEPTQSYQIYIPTDSADGLEHKILNVTEITPESVLEELQKHDVLPDHVIVNNLLIDGTLLKLDFNQAFADLICSTGSAGEMMIIGSVVNTYLSAYQSSQVESILITVNGNTWESGHVIDDEPIGPME